MKQCALHLRKEVISILLVLLVLVGNAMAQETPMYFSKSWRDSVNEYHGRLDTYHQELYSYDMAMSFAVLPVVGESYVGKTAAGIAFLTGRTHSLAATAVGAVRLIEGKPKLALNIGLVVGGIVSYFLLKWWEISDVMHVISNKNEALVNEYGIDISDVEAGSIRYPEGVWPASVTQWPEPRHPVNAREAIDNPLHLAGNK